MFIPFFFLLLFFSGICLYNQISLRFLLVLLLSVCLFWGMLLCFEMFVLHLNALDHVYSLSHHPGELQIGRQLWNKLSYIKWATSGWGTGLRHLLLILVIIASLRRLTSVFQLGEMMNLKILPTSRNFSVFQNLVRNTCDSNIPTFYLFLFIRGNQLACTSWEKSFPTQYICITSSLPLIWSKGNKIIGQHNESNQVLNYRIKKLFNII